MVKFRYFSAVCVFTLTTLIFPASPPGGPSFEGSQPMTASTATGGTAVTTTPITSQRVVASATADLCKQVLALSDEWQALWQKIEANVLAAWRQLYTARAKKAAEIIQQDKGQVPEIHKIVAGYAANDVPTIDKLLMVIFPQELKNELNSQIKWSESVVSALKEKNEQKFNQFNEQMKKSGVTWPHSPVLQKLWLGSGFVFRPMLIKRDRMFCELCMVEVVAIEPWMHPPYYHNMSKHAAGYTGILAKKGLDIVEYGQKIPPEDNTRALLDYLLLHIDLYARDNAQSNENAKLWNMVRGTKMQLQKKENPKQQDPGGWRHFAEFVQNRSAYLDSLKTKR